MRTDDCQKLLALIDAAKTEISAAQNEIKGRKKRRVKDQDGPNGQILGVTLVGEDDTVSVPDSKPT